MFTIDLSSLFRNSDTFDDFIPCFSNHLGFSVSCNKYTCLKPLKIKFTIVCSTLKNVLANIVLLFKKIVFFSVALCNSFSAQDFIFFPFQGYLQATLDNMMSSTFIHESIQSC